MFYSLTIDGTTRKFPTFPKLHAYVERYGQASMQPNGTVTRFNRVVGTWTTETVSLTKSYVGAHDRSETDYWDRVRDEEHVARALRVRTTMVNGVHSWAEDLAANYGLDTLAAYFAKTGR